MLDNSLVWVPQTRLSGVQSAHLQAGLVQLAAEGVKPLDDGGRDVSLLRVAPEDFGDGQGARIHVLLDAALVHPLAPLAGAAAEDEVSLLRADAAQQVDLVEVLPGVLEEVVVSGAGVHLVEVPVGGLDDAQALRERGRLVHGSPVVDDGVLGVEVVSVGERVVPVDLVREVGAEELIEDVVHLLVELLPQLGGGEPVLVHVLVDRRVFPPAAGDHLITAEVHHAVDVGEGGLVEGALFHELLDGPADVGVGVLVRRVQRDVVDVADVARALGGDRRVCDSPAVRVAGHVDFGVEHDAAAERVVLQVFQVLDRVVEAGVVGPLEEVGLGRLVQLERERLCVHQVHVEHVELGYRHRVHLALDVVHADVVPRAVEHHLSPREVWVVVHQRLVHRVGLVVFLVRWQDVHELDERRERSGRAEAVLGLDLDAARGDLERVRLVQSRDVDVGGLAVDDLQVNLAQDGAAPEAPVLGLAVRLLARVQGLLEEVKVVVHLLGAVGACARNLTF